MRTAIRVPRKVILRNRVSRHLAERKTPDAVKKGGFETRPYENFVLFGPFVVSPLVFAPFAVKILPSFRSSPPS